MLDCWLRRRNITVKRFSASAMWQPGDSCAGQAWGWGASGGLGVTGPCVCSFFSWSEKEQTGFFKSIRQQADVSKQFFWKTFSAFWFCFSFLVTLLFPPLVPYAFECPVQFEFWVITNQKLSIWLTGKKRERCLRQKDFAGLKPGSGIQWCNFCVLKLKRGDRHLSYYSEPVSCLGSRGRGLSLIPSSNLWCSATVLILSARSQWWNMKTFWWYLGAGHGHKIFFLLCCFTAVSWAAYASSLLVCFITACVWGKQVVTGKSADGFLSFDPICLICRFFVTSCFSLNCET